MAGNPVDWSKAGPPLVALAILVLIGAITISAIFAYSSVDDALKFWAALSGIVGVVTGAFVSYFFTRSTVENANNEATTARTAEQAAQKRADGAHRALSAALAVAPNNVAKEIRADPAVKSFLG